MWLRSVVSCLIVALVAAAPAGAINASVSAQPQATTSTTAVWTVMIYISGDNNLEKFVVNDLEDELGGAGSSADVQIVALADRGPGYDTRRGNWKTTKLFHVTKGMRANAAGALADWGERDMGDPRTLQKFVGWSKASYPADHYALYFWGHGWSWHPGWVLEDDTDKDTLDYKETKGALPSLGFLDVVGYDGCNMASIEIMKLWNNHAQVVSSSQEWVGWDGLEYDVFLKQLKAHPNMSVDRLAIRSSQSTTTSKTWSTVAVDHRLDDLLRAVDKWSIALRNRMASNRRAYHRAFDRARSYWAAPMDKDLFDLVKKISHLVPGSRIHARGRAVLDAVSAAVLYEHHASNKAGSHGITIYGPGSKKQQSDNHYYQSLGFARATHWDEFLRALNS